MEVQYSRRDATLSLLIKRCCRILRIMIIRSVYNFPKALFYSNRGLHVVKKVLFPLLILIALGWKLSVFYTNHGSNLEPGTHLVKRHYHGYKECAPNERKIGFLKTHKCASSTVQNLLMRLAVKHKFNVVLPVTGNYVGRYRPFHRSALWGTPWNSARLEYDLFCLHTIWNFPEVEQVLGTNTVYFSILRDPLDLFLSLWDYASLGSYFKMSLEEFAFRTDKTMLDRSKVTNLGRNQMLWDFGLPKMNFDDDDSVEAKIAEIEEQFDLILITENFGESMILLKDLLCLDFEDITYFKINSMKTEAKSVISKEAQTALRDWLSSDYKLYRHFEKIFRTKVKEFGEKRMSRELEILETANSNVADKCNVHPVDNDQLTGENKLWGKDMVGYTVGSGSEKFCKFYGLAEMSFLDLLRDLQSHRAEEVLISRNRTFAKLDQRQAFNPVAITDQHGRPDIKRLQELFGRP